jgi:pimeloyl-ACP methyl ester carboxylesterase
MSLFCLVHGSTQDPRGWDLLIPKLEALGHDTIVVDLPADQPGASATVYADRIADSLDSSNKPSDAILVAHSASGLFLPLVPAKRPVARLVFLAAVIPAIGKSLIDQVRSDPDMMNPDWRGKNPIEDDRAAMEFLFHDCSPEVARWAMTTRRLMMARQAMLEVFPIDHWPAVPCCSIVCGGDRTIQPAWSRRMARERLGVQPIELEGGHCPHVSRPASLAEALHAISVS